MPTHPLLTEPGRVDEPRAVEAYSDVFSKVAAEGKPVIVRREGVDLAAVISLEHLELVREILAREEVEQAAERIDWERARKQLRPAQDWLEGEEPKPF
jgi:PHD/YefM family antitoxin component YafN of YafNO toxin-antitoxin module